MIKRGRKESEKTEEYGKLVTTRKGGRSRMSGGGGGRESGEDGVMEGGERTGKRKRERGGVGVLVGGLSSHPKKRVAERGSTNCSFHPLPILEKSGTAYLQTWSFLPKTKKEKKHEERKSER